MRTGETLRPNIPPVPLAELLDEVVDSPIDVSGVSIDSGDMDSGWVFVGTPGANHHGAQFAKGAKKLGAVALVTDEEGAKMAADVLPVVIVEDPHRAADTIAARLYKPHQRDIVLGAITGTNGKTTTTHMLRSALRQVHENVALMATGTMDVTGETTYMLRTTAEAPVIHRALALAAQSNRSAAVIEVSSHAMSLNRLAGLHFKSVGFTNLQHDHLDYYQNMDAYFAAKASLFEPEHADQGVVCIDDEWGMRLSQQAQIPIWTLSAFTEPSPAMIINPANHWQAMPGKPSPGEWGIPFTLIAPDGTRSECFSPIPGVVNVQNAALAILVAVQMGVPLNQAIAGVRATPPVEGRMEMVRGESERAPMVLVDYAHTPEAFEYLLQTVRPLVGGELVMCFGTDGDRDPSKREELGEIAARLADTLWVTDENPRHEDPQEIRDYLLRGIKRVRPQMEKVTEVKESRRDAVRMAILAAGPDDLVVIPGKGSEAAQEIQGVFHAYSDSMVAKEVLAAFK